MRKNCRKSVCYCSEYVDVPMTVYYGEGANCGDDAIVRSLEDINDSIENLGKKLCCCQRSNCCANCCSR